MNVAIFTDNDFDKVNGVTTTLRAVLQCTPPGIRPRVYTASSKQVDTSEYFAVRSLGMPIPFYPEMQIYLPRLRRLSREARRDHVDVIHMTTPGPVGLAAMRIARRLGIPMVGSFHTDLAAYARILSGSAWLSSLTREFMRWPYGRCDRLLVPSEATRDLLLGAKAVPGRIAIWKRGVDSVHFTPAKRSQALRDAWRVPNDCPVILYVGRVSREKGLDVLPGIHQHLSELGVRHRFIIAGQGPMLEELRRRMSGAVFTGVLDRDQVAIAFASADVFLFPSRTDTAGNVVLEAQASGLPVLVSDAGGPRENMIDGHTGRMVEGVSPAAWAAALTPLLGDRAERTRMSRAARAYGEARTWRRALEPLYRTYRELASASAPSSALPGFWAPQAPFL